MKQLFVAFLFVFSVIEAMAMSSEAPPGNWNKVAQLPAGSEIELRMSSGDVIRAEFSRLREDAVEVVAGGQTMPYPRSRVAEVRLVEQASRGRKTALWGLVGFASGFGGACAVWGIGTKGDDTVASDFLEIGSIAGAIGAGVGALLGATRSATKRTVIYRAP
jgi:hypothetical protein